MTDKKILFQTGDLIYDKEWYQKNGIPVKPVVYTDSFLKEIAESTLGCSLELTHGESKQDVIGHTTDFEFVEGQLLGTVSSNQSDEGLGYSPEFKVNFKDLGDKYEAVDGELLRIILTDSPRSKILCNSIEGGSDNMSEETIKVLNSQIKDLNQQIAQKDATIKANKKKIDEYEELLERVSVLEKENSDYKAQIDGLKPKADAYQEFENNKRQDLLEKAFGDNEEMKKSFAEAPLSQLEGLVKYKETTKPAKGVGAAVSEGQGEGGSEKNEPSKSEKALEHYKKTHNGEIPSFLKENKED